MSQLVAGNGGFLLVNLALVAALVATVAFFAALRGAPQYRPGWLRMGVWAFGVHVLAVLCVVGLLLGLLFTHQFQYQYVWAHSSRELPAYFVLACLWEGQEGSFLIWMVWQALLGVVVWFTAKSWRAGVLGVLASVQAVLATMLLGISLSQQIVTWLLVILLLFATGYFIRWLIRRPYLGLAANRQEALLRTAAALLLLLVLTNLFLNQTGYWQTQLGQPAFLLETLFILLFLGLLIFFTRQNKVPFPVLASGLLLGLIALALAYAPLGSWRVGSSPFLLLHQAMPDQAVYRQNPAFIPQDGNGLNPLLQNYWMVIHPPTLFLGFSLSLIPFGFVVTALLQRQYYAWAAPAAPWLLATLLVLGVGILMGGYWAYETLNFGGYWNWDPVENASLVPWLVAVGALHSTLAQQRGKARTRQGMLLVLVTFLLVLYSTFLTRSGVLGDASVHSFTDLGLSGQLLLFLFAYAIGTVVLVLDRWRDLPRPATLPPSWSREFFLWMATVVLLVAACQITLVTSLPVINKLLGTHLAAPGRLSLFYYKWNVWIAIAIAGLSAVGQFIYWTKTDPQRLGRALLRSFLIAVLAAVIVMLALFTQGWDFAFTTTFRQALATTGPGLQGLLSMAGFRLLLVSDELLLFTSLFTILANLDILYRLVRTKRSNTKRLGGSLAHVGFGLILLGVLFSAGYEATVSINFTPAELGNAFPDESRNDNVLLLPNRPKYVRGYRVTYLGKRQAQAPIHQLKVLYQDAQTVRVVFKDSTGERYGVDFPRGFFQLAHLGPAGSTGTPSLELLTGFINQNLRLIRPKLLNHRTLYALRFVPLADSSHPFTLYPEAEVNERMGLIAHPARHVALVEDLYTYISSIPAAEADTAQRKLRTTELRLAPGDTAFVSRAAIVLEKIVQVKDVPSLAQYDVAARAKLKVLDGGISYPAEPMLLIKGRNAQFQDAFVDALELRITFAGADPEAGKVVLQVEEALAPEDYLTFKAIAKPYINLVWLGAVLMSLGFGLALVRRMGEVRKLSAS